MASGVNTTLVDVFLALQISGAAAFALTVLSACIFRGTKRHPIWFSFSVPIITFADPLHDSNGIDLLSPFFGYGDLLGFSHSPSIKYSFRSFSVASEEDLSDNINTILVLPWIMWIAILLGLSICFIARTTSGLIEEWTYCVIGDYSIPKMTSISTTIASASIIAVESTCPEFINHRPTKIVDLFANLKGFIALLLYRNRAIVNIFSQSLTMAIRILIFTILGFGAIAVGLIFTVTRTRGIQFDIIIAVLPPAAALIFGTQMDLLRGCVFWRQHQPIAPDQTLLTLTTVESSASHVEDTPATLDVPDKPPSLAAPTVPRPWLPNAPSFLHF
ncbi:hypothetical protein CPB84DRAFT_1843402 [Gymnopilus junonius]|uniref:Uncharacterized protein n=1 Tax=Gymnopilus junonius TaxID=109634 RepID=A0A9P5TS04_GYMJU|nr:hypothetical protein CPB84DRAFT_1843402 [Gymnopilus junonius]